MIRESWIWNRTSKGGIVKLREFFTDESKWCQGTYFKNELGEDLPGRPYSFEKTPNAKACLLGGLWVCYPDEVDQNRVCELLVDRLDLSLLDEESDSISMLSRWNDVPERTFADIKALIEELDV